jgi:hypothetical protein
MFKFCFWIIKWCYFKLYDANIEVKFGIFEEKFKEFAAKIRHFDAKE